MPAPHNERGAVSTELVVATPLMILLILGVVQFALWQHAGHAALAAARAAATAARVDGGSEATGTERAYEVLDVASRGVIENPSVVVTRTADVVQVEVKGTAVAVMPGVNFPVKATAVGQVERFRSPVEP